jgi:hypothetical protein
MTMRKLITFRRIGLYLSLAAIVLWVESAVAEIWFVNLANDTGTEDGTSWETALVAIQPGVDAAFESGGGEVWVANGVYSELREGTVDVEPDPVEEILVESGSLVTKPGVNLYGGFLGTESLLEERDPNPRLSVIDGSRSRGGEAAYFVIFNTEDIVIDGFTITGVLLRIMPILQQDWELGCAQSKLR